MYRLVDMRVIAKKALVLFYTVHPDAKTALEEWYEKTVDSEWENFSHIKKTFNSADLVGGNRVVFNIKGNKYRLIVLVLFKVKMVYIRFVGTHTDYDRLTDIDKL